VSQVLRVSFDRRSVRLVAGTRVAYLGQRGLDWVDNNGPTPDARGVISTTADRADLGELGRRAQVERQDAVAGIAQVHRAREDPNESGNTEGSGDEARHGALLSGNDIANGPGRCGLVALGVALAGCGANGVVYGVVALGDDGGVGHLGIGYSIGAGKPGGWQAGSRCRRRKAARVDVE
jgi:hypothetical protein